MSALPALEWTRDDLARHRHHHHRFDKRPPSRPGAEMEVARGRPYHCTFCAEDNFRDDYRRRPLDVILTELDRLRWNGVEYVYFIDEIFVPNRELLEALVPRAIRFGIQTRIDLWSLANLELLGRAGCVSIEAGVESITIEGRNQLDKGSRLTTAQINSRLVAAKQHVPFVQASLLESGADDPVEIERWREHLRRYGVWANKPVPMFSYPCSPDYARVWGMPDDRAWERAMKEYRNLQDFPTVRILNLNNGSSKADTQAVRSKVSRPALAGRRCNRLGYVAAMRERQPRGQLAGRLLWGLAVEGHHRGRHARLSCQLSTPSVTDGRHVDLVRTPTYRFFETVNDHLSGSPSDYSGMPGWDQTLTISQERR